MVGFSESPSCPAVRGLGWVLTTASLRPAYTLGTTPANIVSGMVYSAPSVPLRSLRHNQTDLLTTTTLTGKKQNGKQGLYRLDDARSDIPADQIKEEGYVRSELESNQ